MNKEHASITLKQKALQNISNKHNIIKNWIGHGIPFLFDKDGSFVRDKGGEKILDFFPTSLNTFYKWNGSQNCLVTQNKIGKISGTGTTTLDNEQDLKDEISSDINILKKQAKIQLLNSNKTSILDDLKNELLLTNLQRSAAEKKYLEINLKYEENKVKLKKEKRTHQQTITHLTKMLANKDSEINDLNLKLSELRKTLDKLAPLQIVR